MGNLDDGVNDKFSHLKEGEIILIENIRFLKMKQMMMKIFQKNKHLLVIFISMTLFLALTENNRLFTK